MGPCAKIWEDKVFTLGEYRVCKNLGYTSVYGEVNPP